MASSRKPPPNALPLRIRATTRSGTIGRICATRAGYCGRANGVTARPASVWRGLPRRGFAGWTDARLAIDIQNAVEGVKLGRPTAVDTLCCGALGGVEFFCAAGDALGRDDLRALAAQRLTAVLRSAAAAGDYRWNSGKGRFNLGLFRGLAGVGYTAAAARRPRAAERVIWE